jgi:hypothetical protein
MLVVGDAVDAEGLARSGLAVLDADPEARADALAAQLSRGAPRAQAAARDAVQRGRDLTLADALRLESDLNLLISTTDDRAAGLVASADLLVEGHPPRVLANAGIAAPPTGSVLRVAAFADTDRPGYGPAAEARGGWAARHAPPRLGRTSVADPVAGMVGAVTAVALLRAAEPGATARISLEGAVGRLLARERRGG